LIAGALMILALPAISSSAASPAAAQPSGFGSEWTVYHHDGLGSGVDPTGGTNLAAPSPAWNAPVDGQLYGEPLVDAGRVFVATENNTVYALAANNGAVMWATHIAAPVPSNILPCGSVNPWVGITSTPVIDPGRNEIFVVDDQATGGGASHHLVGLNLLNGAILLNTAVDPPGSHPLYQLQRPGLALDRGQVIIGFGGNNGDCETDANPYHGWLVAVPEGGGAMRTFEAAANAGDSQAAIWMGGAAPIVDAAGNIWVATGNSAFVSAPEPYDNSDGVLELNASLQLEQAFAPSTWLTDNAMDLDLGSSSPSLMADGLVLQAGKSRNAYVMSQSHLGGVGGQENTLSSYCGNDVDGGSAISGDVVYTPCENGVVATQVTPGNPPTITPLWQASNGVGGPPILAGGLVWTIDLSGNLYGLDPGTGDPVQTFSLGAGEATDFPTPAVGDGLLLAPTSDSVVAFDGSAGLPPPPGFPPGSWSAFHALSGPGTTRGAVTFAPGSNGSLQELFATSPRGQVLLDYETAGGAWRGWQAMSPAGLTTTAVTFAPGSNGSLQELFVAGSGSRVWMEYEVAGGAWRGWQALSGTGLTGGPVTAAPGSNGSLGELFVPGPDSEVWTAYEYA
jgi:outer membrane protein assembly factor BamB